jgi:hypothetical protein
MDLIKFIIIAFIIVILFGCCFLANSGYIANYLSETTLQAYDRYNVRLVDNNDINYLKLLMPSVTITDNIPQKNKIIALNPTLGPSITAGNTSGMTRDTVNDAMANGVPLNKQLAKQNSCTNSPAKISGSPIGKIEDNKGPKKSNVPYNPNLDPNSLVPDNALITQDDVSRNYGDELPWDREIGFCEVLKGTDRDLYQNVQNSTIITFY